MDSKLKQLKLWIDESKNIVFLGGAGVSTESGVPDFRSKNGLYTNHANLEKMLSIEHFEKYPEDFYTFFRESAQFDSVEPNEAHKRLAQLEKEGKLQAIITQNVDGLHQKAGSKNVLELHGNNDFHCQKCNKKYSKEEIAEKKGVPYCECGGIIRPNVVFYGEALNPEVLTKAVQAIEKADMLIVGGTSLVVYPAAGLLDYFKGRYLVLINEQPKPYDYLANLTINNKIGEVFFKIIK